MKRSFLFLFALFSFGVCFSQIKDVVDSDIIYKSKGYLALYNKPSSSSLELYSIQNGELFQIISKVNNFIEIKLLHNSSKQGWIYDSKILYEQAQKVEISTAEKLFTNIVDANSGTLDLFKSNYKLLKSTTESKSFVYDNHNFGKNILIIPEGKEVILLEYLSKSYDESWYKIFFENKIGWTRTDNLRYVPKSNFTDSYKELVTSVVDFLNEKKVKTENELFLKNKEIARKDYLEKALSKADYDEIIKYATTEEIEKLNFKNYFIIAKQLRTQLVGEKLFNKIHSWGDYESFLNLFPSYSSKIEEITYKNLQERALNKNWCSYCCEVYLMLFNTNKLHRENVVDWRKVAYDFELSEKNAKIASDNLKSIQNANNVQTSQKSNEGRICTTCGGRGVCLRCNGKGYRICDNHDTNGDGHCTTCDDRGSLSCYTCDDTGLCQSCKGKGRLF